MNFLHKQNATLAIEIEDVEGVNQGTPAATSFIKANADAVVMNPLIEELTQNLLGSGIAANKSNHGLKSGQGSIGMPMATSLTEGGVAPISKSIYSLLGKENVFASLTTTAATTTVLTFAAPHGLVKNDVVIVKTAGAFEKRPIESVTSLTITLKWALSVAPDAITDLAAFRMYKPSCTSPSLTITQYLGTCDDGADAIIETLEGAKTESMSFDSFVTGQNAAISFNYQAIRYTKSNGAAPSPSYTQAESSAVINALIFQNGQVFSINEFGLSIQNTLSKISDTKNGVTSIKTTARMTSGKINPYQVSGSSGLAQYNRFNANESFSLLVSKSNPTATEGEDKNVTTVWMPNCQIQGIEKGDYNSFITENVSFKAFSTDTEEDVYICIS